MIFVHNTLSVVQQFVSLMGGRNVLQFGNRSEADSLIQTYCAAFVPSFDSRMTKKIDTEIEKVWTVTERLKIGQQIVKNNEIYSGCYLCTPTHT